MGGGLVEPMLVFGHDKALTLLHLILSPNAGVTHVLQCLVYSAWGAQCLTRAKQTLYPLSCAPKPLASMLKLNLLRNTIALACGPHNFLPTWFNSSLKKFRPKNSVKRSAWRS